MSDAARAVSELLTEIRTIRSGMLSYAGWSWRAAGYHYDPEARDWERLDRLVVKLDAALAVVRNNEGGAVKTSECPGHAYVPDYRLRHCTQCGHMRDRDEAGNRAQPGQPYVRFRWSVVNREFGAVVFDGLFENEAQLIARQHDLVALPGKVPF